MTTMYQNDHDELVGTLFFQANVALSLAQADNMSPELLRSRTLQFITSYDYHAADQHLRAISVNPIPKTDSQPRKSVFQLVGCIHRTLPAAESHHIAQHLLKFGRGQETRETPTSNKVFIFGPSQRFRADQETSPDCDLEADEILPRFTSALYEEAQRRDVALKRSISMVSLEPRRIKVTVYFGALEATGVGRNKKIAGHLAAKNVCDKLKIRL